VVKGEKEKSRRVRIHGKRGVLQLASKRGKKGGLKELEEEEDNERHYRLHCIREKGGWEYCFHLEREKRLFFVRLCERRGKQWDSRCCKPFEGEREVG